MQERARRPRPARPFPFPGKPCLHVLGRSLIGRDRTVQRCLALGVMACVMLHPTLAQAQASLAGVARDSSGAVLPGVTVEAASSVLIEKVRTALTYGSGQYRLTELPPGTYTVTFTLPGFSTVRREGVNVGGVGVTTINADMRIGGLQETITVTGETPIVCARIHSASS